MNLNKPSFGEVARLLVPERSDFAIIVVFGAVAGGLTLIVPVAVQSFVNSIAFTALAQPLVVLTCVVAAVLCISGFARLCQSIAVEMLQRRIFERLVTRLATGLPRATAATYRAWRGSELSARFFEVVTIQKVASTLLLDGLATVLQTLLGMVLLAFYHPALLAFDIVLVIVLALIVFGLARGGVGTAFAESQKKYDVHRHIDDLTMNPMAFRAPATAAYAATRLRAATSSWLEARGMHFRVVLRQNIGVVALQAAASAALLAIGGAMVLRQQLSLGQLVAAEIVVTAVLTGASRLAKYLESLYDLLASTAKLGEVFAIPVEPDREASAASPTRPAELEARDLRFTYPGATKPAVSGFAMRVASGRHTAICGETSSGKSAIASLLAVQSLPQEGQLSIDGIDAREWQALRDRVFLLSRCEVIAGTVLDNVRLGKPVTTEAAYAALHDMGLAGAISALPDGAHTRLNVSETPFSEGERVLLCLARAIAQAPRLLIVDGVLDALDRGIAERVLARLTAPSVPWTLVLTTRSRELAQQVGSVVELSRDGQSRSA